METPQELISAKRMRLDENRSQLGELQHNIALLEKNIEQAVINNNNDLSDERINYSREEKSNSLKQELVLAKHKEELLISELEKQRIEFDELFAIAQRFEEKNNALIHSRELYNAIRERLDQKNMERNVPGPITISMWALASSEPSSDSRIFLTSIVLVLWLGISSGIVLISRMCTDKRDKSQSK